jgi:hypothetical protein
MKKSAIHISGSTFVATRKPKNDRERLLLAFYRLSQQGYETHARFWCCMTCGLAALKEETTHYVFWHAQDDASAFGEAGDSFQYTEVPEGLEEREGIWKHFNTLLHPLHLRWGGNADTIRAAFHEQGFATQWEGTDSKAIIVLPRSVKK